MNARTPHGRYQHDLPADRLELVPRELTRAIRASLRAVALSGALAAVPPVSAAEPLANALPQAATNFVHSGQVEAPRVEGNTLTVTQQSQKATLNWQSFDVGRDAAVRFDQRQGAASVVLNRIHQGAPSQIFGRLDANGQVYLINQNGILFGRGAQVNVNTLIASSLDVQDQVFEKGVLSAIQDKAPAFAGSGGFVRIDEGAQINAARGGRVLVFAPSVENRGVVTSPDGQTVLAAGEKIYLVNIGADNQNHPELSGQLLVEVDVGGVPAQDLDKFLKGEAPLPAGTATNIGRIDVGNGNVTLVGLAVNQLGRVSATTAVRRNGSIRLVAQDQVNVVQEEFGTNLKAQRAGAVRLGAGSVSEITLDARSGDTDVDVNAQPKSQVEIAGHRIHMERDARIVATGGKVNLTARANPSTSSNALTEANDSRIYLEQGSVIDVAGAHLVLPVERNLLEVKLSGDHLKNSPLQRDGVLRNKTIRVDIRERGTRADGSTWIGTPLADLSGDVQNVRRTVAERNLAGGSVNLDSQGEVIVRDGATINVSGGQTRYREGLLNTTLLLADGRMVNIAQADPNRVYQGIADTRTRVYKKWGITITYDMFGREIASGRHEPGYVEGKDAGSVKIVSPRMWVEGAPFQGGVTSGLYQRVPAPAEGQAVYFDHLPRPGKLILGEEAALIGSGSRFRAAPGVRFGTPAALGVDFDPVRSVLPADDGNLVLTPAVLGEQGMGRLAVYSQGRIYLPEGVRLAPPAGGEVILKTDPLTQGIDLDGEILVSGGRIIADGGALRLGPNAVLDAAGRWVNDSPLLRPRTALAPLFIDGGAVSLGAQGDLLLRPGSRIDVSGGAWLKADGKLIDGRAGGIDLSATTPLAARTRAALQLDATLRGYALSRGGTLTVSASRVCIGAGLCPDPRPDQPFAPPLILLPAFFQHGGFENYSVRSRYGDLTVTAGAPLEPRMDNFILNPGFVWRPSGLGLDALSRTAPLPDWLRRPTHLDLQVALRSFPDPFHPGNFQRAGILDVQQGAHIRLEAQGRLRLSSNSRLFIDGVLETPAGQIILKLTPDLEASEFLPAQTLWLGANARIHAPGSVRLAPHPLGWRSGEVLAGGRVEIQAKNGYIVTEAGATLDVSGTSATLDLPQPTGTAIARRVDSDAGVIAFSATEGMFLDGTLVGNAGGAQARGAEFYVRVDAADRVEKDLDSKPFPTAARTLVVRESSDSVVPAGLRPGDAVPTDRNGQAVVKASMLRGAGIDAAHFTARSLGINSLQSYGEIRFEGSAQTQGRHDLSLAFARRLVLDAPVLSAPGTRATLAAPYVAIGSTDAKYQDTPAASGGPDAGNLRIEAQLIDVIGKSVARDVNVVELDSQGDIRLRGLQSDSAPDALRGGLAAYGHLSLRADQIYPTTLSRFDLSVQDALQGVLSILPGESAGGPVLSAGGVVNLQAATTRQAGTLKAPIGELNFSGTDVTLAPGSLTSVSADGQTILFGRTQAGESWIYPLAFDRTLVFEETLGERFSGLPQKRVAFNADSVALREGAVVDLSGGGDLLAYEFVPGPGGTFDVLEAGKNPTTFAILPISNPQFAPFDPLESRGFVPAVGESIYLAGAPGLAAGTYALLPARFALLPGAWLVSAVDGYRDIGMDQRFTRVDGAHIVAGYRTVAGTSLRDSRSNGFIVRPGLSVARDAQYTLSTAGDFFTEHAARNEQAIPRRPHDAGILSLSAGQSLALDAVLRAAGVQGGKGAGVDISAEKIAVVSHNADPDIDAGFFQLETARLNALGVESLLIGGTRRAAADGTEIEQTASQVIIKTDADSALKAPEILIVARDAISVRAGSVLAAEGQVHGVPDKLIIGRNADANGPAVDGDGALLRLSAGQQAELERRNVARARGTLDVQDQTTLRATGSMILDATSNLTSKAQLDLPKGSLQLGAPQISLGQAPADTAGLNVTETQIASLVQQNIQELILRSYSDVDLYGSLNVNLERLRIDAAGISGHALAGERTTLSTRGALHLSNAGQAAAGTQTDLGSGDLALSAGETLSLGDGEFSIAGFQNVALRSGAGILGSGRGTVNVAGGLTLSAPLIGAESGATTTLAARDANGTAYYALRTEVLAGTPTPIAAEALGARLNLIGARVEHGGRIVAHGGYVDLAARGSGTDDGVNLAEGASIDVSGTDKLFGDKRVAAPAGEITLASDRGNVTVASGARLNLAASAAGGNAGTLNVVARAGRFTADGAIDAHAAATDRGGQFRLDVGQLDDFSALNNKLNLGGFTDTRALRVRAGDVTIAAPDTVNARTFRLGVDSGRIDVFGTIHAAGANGGEVALEARDAVRLRDGATINAQAEAAGGAGGQLTLRSVSDGVFIDTQAEIQLGGRGQGRGGELSVSLPRASVDTVLDTDIANDRLRLAGSIEGARSVQVEGVAVYQDADGVIDAAETAAEPGNLRYADALAFMQNAAAVRAAVRPGGEFELVPGVEIRAAADLSVNSPWDLASWRFPVAGSEPLPGILSLRAGGNLWINESLSDGFNGPSLRTDRSWSYRLVAGADLNGAQSLSLLSSEQIPPGGAHIELAAGTPGRTSFLGTVPPVLKQIRTGTGSIELAAAGNLRLGNQQSVIYTAGRDGGLRTSALLSNRPLPIEGGDLRIDVRGDVYGAESNQFVTAWLHRTGNDNSAAQWTIAFENFEQNIGTLGGGALSVRAGGDIVNLSASVPTVGSADAGVLGGGTLSVIAGGDIKSGLYYLGRGVATLRAGENIDAARFDSASGQPLHLVLALSDGQANVSARGHVNLESVVNPTVLPQAFTQLPNRFDRSRLGLFFTYTPEAAVHLTSVAGDVAIHANKAALGNGLRASTVYGDNEHATMLAVFAPTLTANALSGNIEVQRSFTLFPGNRGTLELLADGNVRLLANELATSLLVSDADPLLLPRINRPVTDFVSVNPYLASNVHAATPVHSSASEASPIRIVARRGDIEVAQTPNVAQLLLPKSALISAGRDIVNLYLDIQNLRPADITQVRAGRDIVWRSARNLFGTKGEMIASLVVSGPGQIVVQAGRHIDLGASEGIETRGNIRNAGLLDGGSGITLLAGIGNTPDYDSFDIGYLESSADYRAGVAAYVRELRREPNLSEADALAAFVTLPPAQRQLAILRGFYNELRAAGREAVKSGDRDYVRSFAAIKTLFPDDKYAGDVRLFFSKVYSLDGGDIQIIAPGGLVNAGLATPPEDLGIGKPASRLGIVAQSSGSVRAFVDRDFLVNESRVFAADGGDIFAWSSRGDIDAGRGARTAISAPPPQIAFKEDGSSVISFPPALTGSGIRALVTTEGRTPGDVDLFAPAGVVNAGDAGIASAGNITIGAIEVIGADNISFGGVGVGLPGGDIGLGASLLGASDVGSAVSKNAESAVGGFGGADDEGGLSFLQIDIIGFGE